MNAKEKKTTPVDNQTKILRNENPVLFLTLTFTFLSSFMLFLFTLAPTVTFEDSGELIAAAYNLGIPHQPGYPLFTLMGRVFSLIPIENIAFRLNMMSAFLSALGSMWITWAIVLIITRISSSSSKYLSDKQFLIFLKYGCAFAAGLLMTTAFENWEQSIITEVYGLNTMLTALILFLLIIWSTQSDVSAKTRYYLIICYFLGLTFSNHTTSFMFIPIILGYFWAEDKKFLQRFRVMFSGLPFIILGVSPYIYLPVSSARNPIMDWGNPETLTNFIRTVTRHQYGLDETQSLQKFSAQLETYMDLLLQQWSSWITPFVIILAVLGIVTLFRQKKSYFYLSLLFLFFSIPVTTYLTNFDVSTANKFVASENIALVSVFYIPSYFYVAFLAGIGTFILISTIGIQVRYFFLFTIILLILPFFAVLSNHKKVNMNRYLFTGNYIHNLFQVAEKNGIVFANWDPFYFPLNYAQFVENKRNDVIAIDQQLLRRSWYIQNMRDHYPGFTRMVKTEMDEFLAAVKPFEDKKPYDGNYIQEKYIAMINAIIDRSIEAGKNVYLTYKPPPGVAEKYFKESVLVAAQLKQPGQALTPVHSDKLIFENYFQDSANLDRMAAVFKNYYGGLILSRAQLMMNSGEKSRSIPLFELALKFYNQQPVVQSQIKKVLSTLKSEIQKSEK